MGLSIELVTSRTSLNREDLECMESVGITAVHTAPKQLAPNRLPLSTSLFQTFCPRLLVGSIRRCRSSMRACIGRLGTVVQRPKRITELKCPVLIKMVEDHVLRMQPDFLLVSYLVNTFALEGLERVPHNLRPVTLVDTNDVAYMRCDALLCNGDSPSHLVSREEEAELLRLYDLIISINDEDQSVFNEMVPDETIVTCRPSCAVDALEPPSGRDLKTLLYVAGASSPNAQGLRAFLDDCWPRIRQEHPRVTLKVAGNVCRMFDQRQEPGVDFIGFVPDQRNAYAQAGIVISPVDFGGGLKIKVLEALCFGRTVVASQHSATGLRDVEGHGLLVADDLNDFTSIVNDLLRHPEQVRALCAQAARYTAVAFNEMTVTADLRSAMVQAASVRPSAL